MILHVVMNYMIGLKCLINELRVYSNVISALDLQMPPGFEPGDGEGMDMQLTNKVFNKLKSHSVADTKKRHKIHEKKDHSTAVSF